jgi:hypothetical protein
MTTVHDTRLFDGRRIQTYQIEPFGLQEPRITFETKLYKLNNEGIDILDRYCYLFDAESGHWNWVQSMSYGNPLPPDFPSTHRPY